MKRPGIQRESFQSGTFRTRRTNLVLISFQAPIFAAEFHLLYCSITMAPKFQSGKHSKATARMRAVAHAELPTRYGRFTIYGFQGRGAQEEAVALVRGKLNGKSAPLVRVHSQCLTGDVLTSLRCDCRAQLELSLKKIGQAARKFRAATCKPRRKRWDTCWKTSEPKKIGPSRRRRTARFRSGRRWPPGFASIAGAGESPD